MSGRVANRIERLERGSADTATLALGRAAVAKIEAGVPLDDITDKELQAIIVLQGGEVVDYAAMSDEELAAVIALQRGEAKGARP